MSETSRHQDQEKALLCFLICLVFTEDLAHKYDQTMDTECDLQGWPLYQEATYLTP